MMRKHVVKELSAYCHRELSADESRRVAEHLSRCASCRADLDEIRLGIKLAEQLPRLSAPASLWAEVEDLLDEQVRPESARRPQVGFPWSQAWRRFAAAGLAA